jgi:hypothetical protein
MIAKGRRNMPRFRILNRTSGADFGEWTAADELDALRQVAEMGDCVLAGPENEGIEEHYRLHPRDWIFEEVEDVDSARASENLDE